MKLKAHTVTFFKLMKTVAAESLEDNILKLAAALAYYTIFSLVPMLIIILWVSGMFYDPSMVQGELLIRMTQLLGPEAVKQIQEVMINTKFDQGSGWAKGLGIVTLILTATGVFTEIQDSINTIWGLKAKPKKGFLKLVFNRLTSFSLLISVGFVLVVSLLINALISELTFRIQYYFPAIPVILFYILNQTIIFMVLTFLFASIFKVLPDAKIKWKEVLAGAIITAVFFMGGKYLIGFYLEKNATITAYGSAGSVIVILLWVYFSAIILFFGAEFTQAYLKLKGKSIEPDDYAMWVNEKAIPVKSNTEVAKEKIPQ
ncbi:MAG: YihY/virulence factor BrkB family protein [Bacteroidota bacterium]